MKKHVYKERKETTHVEVGEEDIHQYHVKIMRSGIVNKTRYDDLGKPMQQTNFTQKT